MPEDACATMSITRITPLNACLLFVGALALPVAVLRELLGRILAAAGGSADSRSSFAGINWLGMSGVPDLRSTMPESCHGLPSGRWQSVNPPACRPRRSVYGRAKGAGANGASPAGRSGPKTGGAVAR
jgi:hypothetical protein